LDRGKGSGVRGHAEDAQITRGTVATRHAGFSGTGYVDTDEAAGPAVQWTVHAPYAATASLTIGYANGTMTNRPMDITVNGALVANDLAFLNTLEWHEWETRTLVVPLRAGPNTVRAVAVGAGGTPNLDFLDVRLPPRRPRPAVRGRWPPRGSGRGSTRSTSRHRARPRCRPAAPAPHARR
jgi:hypothetical protein